MSADYPNFGLRFFTPFLGEDPTFSSRVNDPFSSLPANTLQRTLTGGVSRAARRPGPRFSPPRTPLLQRL